MSNELLIFHWYLIGIPVMFGWMAIIDRHELVEAFWGCVLWPLTLVGLVMFIVFYKPMIRRAKERAVE